MVKEAVMAREGGYELNEQVSDHPSYHQVADDEYYQGLESVRQVPNEPDDHPGPGSPSLLVIDLDIKVDRVMPHTHIAWYDSSGEYLAGHLVGSHGCSRATVTVMYERGTMVGFHGHEHGGKIEY